MSVSQPGNVAYGFSQSLLGVPNSPIIAQRNPTTNDKAAVGTIWINVPGNDPWILTSIVDNVATWVNTNASSAANTFVTDSGTAVPFSGVLNVLGGDNIVTSAFGNTIDVAVTPNIDLPATNSAGTQGIYKIGGVDFGFLFPPSSVYVGGAGNTTNNPLLALHNVGVGESALTAITTGNNNTAIGGGTLGSNTTGLNNVALGYLALNTITTGDTNIALGNQAMENILDGNDNLAIGFSAGSNWNGTESSNIAIGHQGVTAEDNAIHIGTQGSGAGQQDTCFIAGIYNVAPSSANQVMFVNNNGKLGSSTGMDGQVIIGSSSGNPAWATLTAGSDITITDASNSITIASSIIAVQVIDGDTGTASGATITLAGGHNITTAGNDISTVTLNVSGTTNHSLQLGNSTGSLSSLGLATNGQLPIGSTGADPVLAALTAGTGISVTNGAGSITIANTQTQGIVTLDGDSGSATGTTITFSGTTNAGSSVSFSASGATVDLNVTDAHDNTLIGLACGNNSLTGFSNTALGFEALIDLTNGSQNIGIGAFALGVVTSGQKNIGIGGSAFNNTGVGLVNGTNNIGIGFETGINYTGAEDSNILINNLGVNGESNTIRIGTQGSIQGQQDACYIAGIHGVTPGGGSIQTVVIDSNGQLGSTSGGSGVTTIDGDTGSATGATITFNANTNSGSSVKFSASGSTVDLDVTDADNNTILGSGSGNGSITGTFNTGIGSSCLMDLTSGVQNVAVGTGALRVATSAGSNVAVGYDSMVFLTTGSSNIALGNAAGQNLTSSESNNIYIGHAGVVSESDTIRIGSTPQTSCYVAGIAGVTVASSAAVLINTSTGQMGTVVSSRRYKENVNEMGPKSAPVLDLRPVTFNYKNDPSRELRYGLIAEEVDEVMPDLVVYNKAGVPETVKYHDLPILLLNELQKQHNLIAELSRRLIRLEERSRYESTR